MNDTFQKVRLLVKPLPLRLVVVLGLLMCLTLCCHGGGDYVCAFQIQHRYSNNNNNYNYHHHHNQNRQPSNNKIYHLQRHHMLTSTQNIRTTTQPEPSLSLALLSTTIDSSSSDSGSNTSDEFIDISSKVEIHESATNGFNNGDGNSLWWKGTQYIQQIRQSLSSMYTKSYDENDDDDDKTTLTFRQRLAKMGLAAMLSYGFVSNMSYAITVSCAWYIHNVQNKVSPLSPGQWKPFLIIYSGFWIFNNIVRPIRLGISLAVVAPQFDRILNYIQTQYHVSRTVAIAVTVFMANVVGTISAMSIGIVIASLLSGVPILP